MDPIAVEFAKARLRKAERAIEALRSAIDFEAAEDAWTDFLLAISAIYAKLEQGAKVKGKSSAWFGRKKNERQCDPLLRYLRYARNADEHGIERVVSRFHDTGPIWGQQPKFGERIPVTIQTLDPITREPVGEVVPGFYSGSTIKLVRAHDRRNKTFCDPPQKHLDISIMYFEEPLDIGDLAISYVRRLVAEAEELI